MEKYFNKIVVVALLLGSAVFIGVFLLWPVVQEFSQVERELEQYDRALRDREEYVANLAALAQQLDTRKESVRKIEAAIPDNTSIPALFDLLQNIASSSGLIVTEMSSIPNEKNSESLNVVVTKISLEAIGTYDTLKAFIAQAKSSARLLEITSISFSSGEAGVSSNPGQFQFSLELETYED